jgi:hypothetical protein
MAGAQHFMGTTFAALRHRDYRIWTGAGFVSIAGTGCRCWVSAGTSSRRPVRRPAWASPCSSKRCPCSCSPPGVARWPDRLPARPLLITTQLAHAALATALAAIATTSAGGLPAVCAISLLGGVVSAVEGPIMGRFGAGTAAAVASVAAGVALARLRGRRGAPGRGADNAARVGRHRRGAAARLRGPQPYVSRGPRPRTRLAPRDQDGAAGPWMCSLRTTS